MASGNQTSSEYVNHHLLHLSNAGDMPVGLFQNLLRLSVLDLHHNLFLHADDNAFRNLSSLVFLDMSENKLSEIDSTLLNL